MSKVERETQRKLAELRKSKPDSLVFALAEATYKKLKKAKVNQ